jgi:iron complex outermembrane receptor protein
MKIKNSNHVALFAIAVASLASPSIAQEAPANTRASLDAEDHNAQDIIVTARLRNERLQDVPVAVSAFSAPELARYNTDSIQQLSARTPTLSAVSIGSPTGGLLSIRGVGTGNAGPQIDQPVSINIDGAQVSQANVMNLGFYDVERVEVLKGPQTLFFGKNSPGGIISIVSAGPGDHLEARLRGGYEFADKSKFVEAILSSPLTDSLGIRVVGYFADQKGWLRNVSGQQPAYTIPASLGGGTTSPTIPEGKTGPNGKTYFARATLAYKPTGGNFDATLKLAYGKKDFDTNSTFSSQLMNCPGGRPQYSIALGQSFGECRLDRNVVQGTSPVGGPPSLLFPDGKPHNDQTQVLATLTANFKPAEQITLTSVSTFYHMKAGSIANNVYIGLDYFRTEYKLDQKQYTQEVRALTSFDSPFNFMLGAYYQNFKNGQRNTVPSSSLGTFLLSGGRLSGPALLGNHSSLVRTKAYSVYGQGIVDIVPELQLTIGGRYSTETKRVSAMNFPNIFTTDTFVFPITPNRRKFDNFSPDVTLTYKPSSSLTLYGAYRKGFLSGGFDVSVANLSFGSRSVGNLTYKQETVEGGEVGAKGSFAGRQVSFDLAVYNYKYRDLQVTSFDLVTLSNRLTNAGTALVRGAELNLQVRPDATPGLTLHGNLSYNPAKYGTFPNAPCYTGQTPAQGCSFRAGRSADGKLVVNPIAPGEVGNVQNLSGKQLDRNPDWSGSVGASFDQQISDQFKLSVSGDAIYTGSYFASAILEPAAYQKSALRFNGRIAVAAPDDRWEIALIGVNLTNKLRALRAFTVPATGGGTGRATGFIGDEAGIIGQYRTITLQATLRY